LGGGPRARGGCEAKEKKKKKVGGGGA